MIWLLDKNADAAYAAYNAYAAKAADAKAATKAIAAYYDAAAAYKNKKENHRIAQADKLLELLREEKYHNHNFNTHTSTRRELGLNPLNFDELL